MAARPGEGSGLRVVNAAADTAFRLALGGHRLTVTHADGFPADDLEAAADVDLGPVAPDRTHRLVVDESMTIYRAARGARDGRLRRRQPRPVDAPLPQCRPPGRGMTTELAYER